MSGKAEVIALIQARGGSKGVPGKNIRPLAGFPLLAWSVAACKLARSIDRTILSTDDEAIAEVGREYGAEVPFMRPSEFATDTATDFPVIKHAIEWLRDNEGFIPTYIVQIRPTTPLRDPAVMDEAVAKLKASPEATGLRSVFEMPESAWKTYEMPKGYLTPLGAEEGDTEALNKPRQAFPSTYFAQGYVDVIRSRVLLEQGQTYGNRIVGFITPDCGEVDCEEDFRRLEILMGDYGRTVYEYMKTHHSKTHHS